MRSTPIDAAGDQRPAARPSGYVFAHDSASSAADTFSAIVEAENGTQTPVLTVTRQAIRRRRYLRSASILLDPWAGQTVHVRFQAVDGGPNNLVEVEIDDVRVTRPS